MSWANVSAIIQFWRSPAPGDPGVTWNDYSGSPASDVSGADQSAILGYLQNLYANSATARSVLDAAVASGQPIRIAQGANTFGDSNAGPGIDPYVRYDLSQTSKLAYFNDQGELVHEMAAITVIHELIHNILGLADTGGSEAAQNGANFDFKGDTVRMQNAISSEMGWTSNIQASYLASFDAGGPQAGSFSYNSSYSNGDHVDIVRVGDNPGTSFDDTLDMSARTDNSVDLLFGLTGDDFIRGGGGNDFLYGNKGDDTVYGDKGKDFIWGGAGSDNLFGGEGDDTIFAGDNNSPGSGASGDADTLFGDAGDDTLWGGAGKDTVNGGAGDDKIHGGQGDDELTGAAGVDEIDGGEGADTLIGGDGQDKLTGGAGADTFVVSDNDIVFDPESSDRLGLSKTDIISGVAYRDPPGSGVDPETAPYELNGYTFIRSGDTLTISSGGSVLATIQNWSDGDLGITLSERDKDRPPHWDDRDPSKPPQRDPVVLDLDGGGITLTNTGHSQAFFDLDGDGFAERVGWFGAGEGILIHDDNGNGVVDGVGELFGTTTTDGLAVLATYDTDLDGKVDVSDADFASLLVWTDANGDGVSQISEVRSLANAGVVSLSVDATAAGWEVGGNFVAQVATFERADGSAGQSASVYLSRHTHLSQWVAPAGFELGATAALLPELQGYGTVKDLSAAMTLDDDLQDAVVELLQSLASNSLSAARAGFEAILMPWAGVGPQTPGSRGPFVDATHLAVVEAFFGSGFIQLDNDGVPITTPNARSGAMVENIYQDMVDEMLVRFLVQAPTSVLETTGRALDLSGTAFELVGKIGFDPNGDALTANLNDMIAALIASAPEDLAARLQHYKDGLSIVHLVFTDLGEVQAAGLLLPELGDFTEAQRAEILDAALGPAQLVGTESSDYLVADQSEAVFVGGQGDDYLFGSNLGDTYIYNLGDGDDVIVDNADPIVATEDRLYFGVGLEASHLQVSHEGGVLKIWFDNTPGSVSLALQSAEQGDGVEAFIFSDGTTVSPEQLAQMYLSTAATDGDDFIEGFRWDETIQGGLGDDHLAGGGGRDTYVYNAGDGDDVIDDDPGWLVAPAVDNVLELGAGLSSANAHISREFGNSDYILSFTDQPGSIRLRGGAEHGAVGTIDFSDGTVWHREELRAFYLANASTDQDDVIIGYFGDQTFSGGLGDDFLAADWGSDTYVYNLGDGHDTISDGASYRNDVNRLVLGTSITPGSASYSRTDNDFIITFADGGSVTLSYQFEPESGLQFVDFANGFSLTWDDMRLMFSASTSGNDELWGTGQVDTLQGGLGDDTLRGGYDSDTYIYAIGDGQDTIIEHDQYGEDVLVLSGIDEADVQIARDGADAIVSFANAAGQIRLVDQFIDLPWDDTGIETVNFADAQWDREVIQQVYLATLATVGDDHIVGFTTADDTLAGGLGDDVLEGRGGSDVYVFAPSGGSDTIVDSAENEGGGGEGPTIADRLDLSAYNQADIILTIDDRDLVVSFIGSTDQVRIVDQFRGELLQDGHQNDGVEEIVFADGGLWNRYAIDDAAGFVPPPEYIEGTAGDDVLVGNALFNTIDARGGDDDVTSEGGDDIFIAADGDGNDVYNGGDGVDGMDLTLVAGNVSIDLTSGLTSGAAGSDILINIENLFSGAGSDTLRGNAGRNILWGGLGDDIMAGSGGADVFGIDGESGADRIEDFTPEEGDQIEFYGGLLSDFDDMIAHAQQIGTDTVVTYGLESSLVLENVALSTLTQEAFGFY